MGPEGVGGGAGAPAGATSTGDPGRTGPARRSHRLVAAAAVAGAVVVHLALQTSMLLGRPGAALSSMRGYYAYDQLSYLAIVVDAARGRSSFVEPFTQTGRDFYPHAYYLLLGAVARVVGVAAATSWMVVGMLVQVVLVAVVGAACVALTRRAWAGLFGALPFVVGTLSTVQGGEWLTRLDLSGVLWGAYGVLFPLNAEAVGLCAAGCALLGLLLVAAGRAGGHARAVSLVACLVLGALSAVHTYAFLSGSYVAAYGAAAVAIAHRRSWRSTAVSVLLLVALLLGGSAVSGAVGPLAVLVLGLVPALPGLLVLARIVRWWLLWCLLTLAVAAAPQVVWTVWGVVRGDPFLLYRQASSNQQSLPTGPSLLSALVPLVVLALVLLGGVRTRRPLEAGLPVGMALAWALLASNDRWGAGQEPYRFWIDGFALVVVLLVPLALGVLLGPAPGRSQLRVPVRAAGGVVAVLLVAAGVPDVVGFWRYAGQAGFISFATPRAQAVAEATDRLPEADGAGLLLPDPCLSAFTTKVRSAGPTAYYNLGMAWPDREPAMRQVLARRRAARLDPAVATRAGVAYVLTDSSCPANWPARYRGSLTQVASAPYAGDTAQVMELGSTRPQFQGSGRVVLWRLRG